MGRFWCMGAVLFGCPSWCHQWHIWVPAGTEPWFKVQLTLVNVQLTTELPMLSLYAFCDVAYRAKIAKQRVYVARVADLALLQQKTHVTSFTWQSRYADIKHNITKPIKVTARDQLVFHYDRIHVYVTLKLSEHERLKVALHQCTSYPPVIIMDLKIELETTKSYLTPHPCFSQSPATDHRHVVSLR